MLQPALSLQRAQLLQAPGKTLAADVLEVAVQRVTRRHIEMRKRIADFFQANAAALGDIQSARQHVGRVLEDPAHLIMTLDKKTGALKLHSIDVLNRLAGLNAEHDILGVSVV